MKKDWTERFQGTAALPRDVRDCFIDVAKVVSMDAGAQIFGPSNAPDRLFFLYDGRIRVSQSSESGRAIVLYRVDAGESCVLTTVAEKEAFRKFVFSAQSRRLIDLLHVVDDVAFGHMDVRLAERLLELTVHDIEISSAHQQLARELGTAREVISRILSDFQKRDLIAQSRGRITLLDRNRLQRIAKAS